MAKPGRLPDFRKMYPEASEEVIEVLRETERKMQYQEYDLKAEQTIIDEDAQEIRVIPSREDSYERLIELDIQFLDDGENVEDQVFQKIQSEMIHKALSFLSDEEEKLIRLLFFEERTEREVAELMGIYHNAVHKRKKRILRKLKNILTKF
ncbi:sigma-70 family RNA polymerase sigma factor [Candidatus Ventrimonas sp. KK005]